MTPVEATTPEPADAGGPVVLLVDDDPDCRMLVRDALESHDPPYRVYECADGDEGLEFLTRSEAKQAPRPDLVFLDLEMPRLNGHKVLSELRADGRFCELPVVVLTGLDDDEQERQALREGANSYTCKERDAARLFKKISAAAAYWTTVHRSLPPRPALRASGGSAAA